MKLLYLLLLTLLLAGGLLIGRVVASRGTGEPQTAGPTSLPAGALEILEARPFILDEPFVHEWRAEKPLERGGFLLALRVDPELARPRQNYEPVLYVGSQTAERCNPTTAADSGVMIVLVPAPVDAHGRVLLDLATTPVWFGSLELPERVDAARIEAERANAHAQGIGATRRKPNTRLEFTAEDAIRARTRWDLELYVEDLVTRHSPPRAR